ncbi:hypothetical protein BAUCODRAFT_36300 [Baudoinia panamericana UAMH 10762]|uniref:Uncharacterized protein n=1 Tax=Baudoinia panamericana (strain UAMH 10762) TaxID=717646 RepID=M2MQS4_BAUPA|nr:uncharacterized protein BAUCODRAFT_36300 [Baudoinia panamericana UAMH 10762]EMC93838.1 hypothetical protein BAUCODRAFT_36300 [Baudoinia panamericana UAMH 10762]
MPKPHAKVDVEVGLGAWQHRTLYTFVAILTSWIRRREYRQELFRKNRRLNYAMTWLCTSSKMNTKETFNQNPGAGSSWNYCALHAYDLTLLFAFERHVPDAARSVLLRRGKALSRLSQRRSLAG